MKNKYTKINWNVEEGRRKSAKAKPQVRRKDSTLTTNYSLMLQLYLINKEEAANRGGARFVKATPKKFSFMAKASSVIMGIVPFFSRIFDYFSRDSKTSVSMLTE